MALIKRKLKTGFSYQVKVRGSDGKWVCESFPNELEAKAREIELMQLKEEGKPIKSISSKLTVHQYFLAWFDFNKVDGPSEGWRKSQLQMFRDYIDPIIGKITIKRLLPADIKKVMAFANKLGRSPQTRVHIYNMLHKMFEDAIEQFEILDRNPVKKDLKPRIPQKQSSYLSPEEAKLLLKSVKNHKYGVAVWLGILGGLRVGEIQALTYKNLDFKQGLLHIRATYVRKEDRFQSYPKGRRWHSIAMPSDLMQMLRERKMSSTNEYVAADKGFLSYQSFYKALKKFCVDLDITSITPHGLRHSASELYMAEGASRDDIRILLNHSSSAVTDLYIHDTGERLKKVAQKIQIGV